MLLSSELEHTFLRITFAYWLLSKLKHNIIILVLGSSITGVTADGVCSNDQLLPGQNVPISGGKPWTESG